MASCTKCGESDLALYCPNCTPLTEQIADLRRERDEAIKLSENYHQQTHENLCAAKVYSEQLEEARRERDEAQMENSKLREMVNQLCFRPKSPLDALSYNELQAKLAEAQAELKNALKERDDEFDRAEKWRGKCWDLETSLASAREAIKRWDNIYHLGIKCQDNIPDCEYCKVLSSTPPRSCEHDKGKYWTSGVNSQRKDFVDGCPYCPKRDDKWTRLLEAARPFRIYKHYRHYLGEECTELCRKVDDLKDVLALFDAGEGGQK